jgi:hypothetical protein
MLRHLIAFINHPCLFWWCPHTPHPSPRPLLLSCLRTPRKPRRTTLFRGGHVPCMSTLPGLVPLNAPTSLGTSYTHTRTRHRNSNQGHQLLPLNPPTNHLTLAQPSIARSLPIPWAASDYSCARTAILARCASSGPRRRPLALFRSHSHPQHISILSRLPPRGHMHPHIEHTIAHRASMRIAQDVCFSHHAGLARSTNPICSPTHSFTRALGTRPLTCLYTVCNADAHRHHDPPPPPPPTPHRYNLGPRKATDKWFGVVFVICIISFLGWSGYGISQVTCDSNNVSPRS